MKTMDATRFFIMALMGLLMPLFAIGQPGNPEARKKADTEHKSYGKRGWAVSEGAFHDVLVQHWEKRLAKDDNDVNVYVIAYGNGNASTLEEAEAQALAKAREQISGPMIMYFQSWNMAMESKGSVTAEESAKIRDAVNATEPAIRQAFMEKGIPADLNMHRPTRNGFEAHIRILYPQLELRQQAKEIVAEELNRIAGWEKDKAFKLMEYPK